MTPIEIRDAIKNAHDTQRSIGLRQNVTISMVNKVVRKKARAKHIEIEIAHVIGKDLHTVFPEWYPHPAR